MIEEFKAYVAKHGTAITAVRLGQKNTHMIMKWLARNKVPEHWVGPVEKLLGIKTSVEE